MKTKAFLKFNKRILRHLCNIQIKMCDGHTHTHKRKNFLETTALEIFLNDGRSEKKE